jgi:hypothetical protein
MLERMDVRIRGGPEGRPWAFELRMRETFHRQMGQVMRESRRVDRRDGWYHKVIWDPATGDVVYVQLQPLEEHVGRGVARRRKNV